MKGKTILILAGAVAAVLVALWGIRAYRSERITQADADATIGQVHEYQAQTETAVLKQMDIMEPNRLCIIGEVIVEEE